jgi:hypothetical protein
MAQKARKLAHADAAASIAALVEQCSRRSSSSAS